MPRKKGEIDLGKFKLTCGRCGSDKVLEKSARDEIARDGALVIYGEGIRRRCQDCDNEEFYIHKTWKE